jgi:hypothetical protein
MCKHCKPKEATPAAEAGTLTNKLVDYVAKCRDWFQDLEYGSRVGEPAVMEMEGTTLLEEWLAYEESRTRNPEPAAPTLRYFTNGILEWRMPPKGYGEARMCVSPVWWESSSNLRDLLDAGVKEIPNPDQQP